MDWKLIAAFAGVMVGLLGFLFGPGIVPKMIAKHRESKATKRRAATQVDAAARKQANATIERMDQYFLRKQGSGDMPAGIRGDFPSGRMLDFKDEKVQAKWSALKGHIWKLCEHWRPGAPDPEDKSLDWYKFLRDDFLVTASEAYD